MPKKVVFFNYFHNGDIHVSREFVRLIISTVKRIEPETQFYYGHRNYNGLLADIPDLIFDPAALTIIRDHQVGIRTINDTIYINTWYGQQHSKYTNNYGLSIDTLYAAFDDACKILWGFSLDSISTDLTKFFPTIDYSKFYITNATKWIQAQPNKKIFISNGDVLSDQAHEFSFAPLIVDLARKHHDKIFILSNREYKYVIGREPNICYSDTIIGKKQNDLNENAFLASHCDVIVGRASGPFTFAMTQETLFQKKKKFLNFCNLIPRKEGKFWMNGLFEDKVNYLSDVIVSNDSNTNMIKNLIDKNILELD